FRLIQRLGGMPRWRPRELLPCHFPELERRLITVIQDRVWVCPMRHDDGRRVEQRMRLVFDRSTSVKQLSTGPMMKTIEQTLGPDDHRWMSPYGRGHGTRDELKSRTESYRR